MKKTIVLLVLLVVLTGCGNGDVTNKATNTSSSTESTSMSFERNWLSINGAKPVYKDNDVIELRGTAKPNTSVVITLGSDNKEVANVKANGAGNFIVSFDAPKSKDEYLFENEREKTFIVLYSKENFEKCDELERKEKEQKDKENKLKQEEIEKQKEEERKQREKEEAEKKVREEVDNKKQEDSKGSETIANDSSISDNAKNEVTKEQKELLIVFTQQDLSERDISYKFQGYDEWSVVTNDTNESKRYVITTQDKKAGRVKSIYEWTGKKDDSATLIYLLVGGEEYINNLNK